MNIDFSSPGIHGLACKKKDSLTQWLSCSAAMRASCSRRSGVDPGSRSRPLSMALDGSPYLAPVMPAVSPCLVPDPVRDSLLPLRCSERVVIVVSPSSSSLRLTTYIYPSTDTYGAYNYEKITKLLAARSRALTPVVPIADLAISRFRRRMKSDILKPT